MKEVFISPRRCLQSRFSLPHRGSTEVLNDRGKTARLKLARWGGWGEGQRWLVVKATCTVPLPREAKPGFPGKEVLLEAKAWVRTLFPQYILLGGCGSLHLHRAATFWICVGFNHSLYHITEIVEGKDSDSLGPTGLKLHSVQLRAARHVSK